MLILGLTFDLENMLYFYTVFIFVSSRVTDAVLLNKSAMQAMIVTSNPDAVIEKIHNKLHQWGSIDDPWCPGEGNLQPRA